MRTDFVYHLNVFLNYHNFHCHLTWIQFYVVLVLNSATTLDPLNTSEKFSLHAALALTCFASCGQFLLSKLVMTIKVRGTQREYSSKLLKNALLIIFQYLNRRYRHIFVPKKTFHLFGFPSWKSSDPKIIGIKTYFFRKFQPEKRLPKILGDLLG